MIKIITKFVIIIFLMFFFQMSLIIVLYKKTKNGFKKQEPNMPLESIWLQFKTFFFFFEKQGETSLFPLIFILKNIKNTTNTNIRRTMSNLIVKILKRCSLCFKNRS